jgi:predicted MFS family arabinose efflux permease
MTADAAAGRNPEAPTGSPAAGSSLPGPHGRAARRLAPLFAVACGLSVANISFAEPLLGAMAQEFGIPHATIGAIVTVTQVGYGIGLLFIVPLGDLLNRRRLVAGLTLLSATALLLVSAAATAPVLMMGMGAVGLLAVVTQVLVAYAAKLADPEEKGQIVGIVTSGVITGIVIARAISGALSDAFGWRSVYLASSVATLLIAIALLRAMPREDTAVVRLPYARLVKSVVSLFGEEPVLRIRATIAMLIFAANAVFWTPLVLPLSAPPFSLSRTEVGLFGLAGAVGAIGAAAAGRLADSGLAQRTTVVGLIALTLAWLPISLLPWSLWGVVAGALAISFALQSVHVSNQILIFRRRPEAQSRLVAAYMIFYSIGSALGSIGSTAIYAAAGWLGVCALGAGLGALALFVWALTLRFMPGD